MIALLNIFDNQVPKCTKKLNFTVTLIYSFSDNEAICCNAATFVLSITITQGHTIMLILSVFHVINLNIIPNETFKMMESQYAWGHGVAFFCLPLKQLIVLYLLANAKLLNCFCWCVMCESDAYIKVYHYHVMRYCSFT